MALNFFIFTSCLLSPTALTAGQHVVLPPSAEQKQEEVPNQQESVSDEEENETVLDDPGVRGEGEGQIEEQQEQES